MTKFKNDRNYEHLSAAEEVIMKVIWDNGEDITFGQLIENFFRNYNRPYVRSTINTFLTKMANKGYVKTYRVNKFAYIHAIISEEQFLDDKLAKECEFWFAGNKDRMMQAVGKISL